MGRGKLFEAWSFRLAQPAPFDDPQYSGAKGVGLSRYNTAGSARKATLHAPTMRALLAYAKLVSACESGAYVEDLGAIGHQDSTYRIAEYCSASKRDCVVFTPNTGKFIVSQFPNGSDTPAPYSVGAGSGSGTALLFCLMPVLEEDDCSKAHHLTRSHQGEVNLISTWVSYHCFSIESTIPKPTRPFANAASTAHSPAWSAPGPSCLAGWCHTPYRPYKGDKGGTSAPE